ncbi:Protein kinase-like domain superfamily [Sesbania bispinosa]|nr:Protein kinase-like domain superfamily [Sesbania bispinosa]
MFAGNSISEEELKQKFGTSKELINSVVHALEGRTYSPNDINISNTIDVAGIVASYRYEYETDWGEQVGWIYGSINEDVLTGLAMHEKGWRSELCTPNPIAFTGCAPVGGPSSMAQQKRWATGLLEVFFTKHCPIFGTLFGKLSFRQCLAYMWIINWGLWPVAEVCYACLVAYCIITNSNFLPQDLGICIPIAFVAIYKAYTLLECLISGMSIRAWWNNQRMSRIKAMNAGFCGFLSVLLKLLRISDTVFDITKKDPPLSSDGSDDRDAGRTSNFSQLLGTSGFESVYKGSLGDGTLVAVKKLDRVLPHGEKEFITQDDKEETNVLKQEIETLQKGIRLLVYEFMKNGSLDK